MKNPLKEGKEKNTKRKESREIFQPFSIPNSGCLFRSLVTLNFSGADVCQVEKPEKADFRAFPPWRGLALRPASSYIFNVWTQILSRHRKTVKARCFFVFFSFYNQHLLCLIKSEALLLFTPIHKRRRWRTLRNVDDRAKSRVSVKQ